MASPRERRILVATALLAVGAPAGAAYLVRDRTAALADHLSSASGVHASIGAVDADLTGTVRLSDVAFGSLVSADSIEASVALDSLLSGDLRADEIQIASPRVAIEVDADGDSNLARLARRLAKRPAPHATSSPSHAPTAHRSPRVRRIVVSEGTLTARIDGVGEISADGVEIVPDTRGARVITGPLRVSSHGGPLPALANTSVDLAFTRSAADISLPEMKLGRVLAVGGTGSVTAGEKTTALRDVAAGRLGSTTSSAPTMPAPIEIRATIDDGGASREVAVDVTPSLLLISGERVPLAGFAAITPKSVHLDNAHATGTLRVARDRGTVTIEADGSIDGVTIEHKTLAEVPLPLSAAVRATARIGDGLTIERLELDMGAIHARASGAFHRGSASAPLSANVDFAIERARCADLLASLPTEVRGPLDGIVLDGEIGLQTKLTIDLAAPVGDGAALLADFDGRCKAISEPPMADVTTLAKHDDSDEDFVEMAKIPGRVQGAFVSAEDGRFWDHDGFDLQQIARSLEIDLRERRLARGGSTISQQLVKNAFLTHRRTLDRKIQEAVLTWRLEARLDKHQILERYLNIIELGPGVRGIGAAAKHWFGTTPRGLTIRQAAFLAAITSEPTSMSRRVRRRGGLDEVSAERVATILRAMRRDGVISSAEHDAARAQSMNFAPAAIRDDR